MGISKKAFKNLLLNQEIAGEIPIKKNKTKIYQKNLLRPFGSKFEQEIYNLLRTFKSFNFDTIIMQPVFILNWYPRKVYTADFYIQMNDGKNIVIECKGYKRPQYAAIEPFILNYFKERQYIFIRIDQQPKNWHLWNVWQYHSDGESLLIQLARVGESKFKYYKET